MPGEPFGDKLEILILASSCLPRTVFPPIFVLFGPGDHSLETGAAEHRLVQGVGQHPQNPLLAAKVCQVRGLELPLVVITLVTVAIQAVALVEGWPLCLGITPEEILGTFLWDTSEGQLNSAVGQLVSGGRFL